MKKYKFESLSGLDIEFSLLPAEEADVLYQSLLLDDNPYLEEHIFNSITTDKYKDEDIHAGLVPLIVYLSLKLSGVLSGKTDYLDMIERHRDIISKNLYMSLYATIIRIQPTYTLETLKTKTLNEIIEMLVFSETLIGKQLVDTKKAREVLAKEEKEISVPVGKKKGISSITKSDLDAIKAAINCNDFDMI